MGIIRLYTFDSKTMIKMKCKNILQKTYCVVILGCCLIPLLCMPFHLTKIPIGNRELSQFPRFTSSYLKDVADWYDERFAFRPEIIAANSAIQEKIFRQSASDEIIVGTGGWLYYSATLDDYQHRNSLSDRMLFNIAHNIALVQEYTESQGVEFLFTIAPNKNSLYSEHMPERYRHYVGDESDAERLLPWLTAENVNYLDLFKVFEEQDEELYYHRDSHWTEKGAVLAYNEMIDEIGAKHIRIAEETLSLTKLSGDLNNMLYPVGGIYENKDILLDNMTWEYTGEADDVEDNYIETMCPNRKGTLLMYRDSFGNALLPYMAETFEKAVFSKIVPYDLRDLTNIEADYFVIEKVERHLPTLGNIAPIMEAPRRDDIMKESLQAVDIKDSLPDVIQTADDYYRINGSLPEPIDVMGKIYISFEGEDSTLYEAFCINAAGYDYGYQACIPVEKFSGDIRSIHIYTISEKMKERKNI